jgi:hypothetical protein
MQTAVDLSQSSLSIKSLPVRGTRDFGRVETGEYVYHGERSVACARCDQQYSKNLHPQEAATLSLESI